MKSGSVVPQFPSAVLRDVNLVEEVSSCRAQGLWEPHLWTLSAGVSPLGAGVSWGSPETAGFMDEERRGGCGPVSCLLGHRPSGGRGWLVLAPASPGRPARGPARDRVAGG